MSLISNISNILGALAAPTPTVYVGGDDTINDFTGIGLKNDVVVFDATKNLDEKFGKGGDAKQDYSVLDGGCGIDTLTIKLTESQYAAYKAEVCAKIGAVKVGGIDFGDIANLFKIATGQTAVKFNSIGVELKGWECIKFEVCKDPIVNSAPVAVNGLAEVKEDAVLHDSVAKFVTDADVKDTLSFHLKGTAPAGLTFMADGSYTFDAHHADYQHLAKGETMPVSVEYCVNDGNGHTTTATLTIKVCGTNDTPTAVADTNSVKEDATVIGFVNTNDGDVDHGHVLTFALTDPDNKPAGLTFNSDGSYSFDAGNPAYQHLAEGEKLDVVVTYAVKDEHGASATSTLTIHITGTADDAPCSCHCHCEPTVIDVNGGFENLTGPAWPQANIDAGVAFSSVAGWTNTGAVGDGIDVQGGIEVWDAHGLALRNPGLVATGNVIETDGLGNGDGDPQPAVKDVYQTTVTGDAGQQFDLSFNYASRGDGLGGGTGNDTDSFEIWWNGTKVGSYDPSSATAWATANLSLTGNASGTNTLEIREAGAEDSYGALIDNVKVVANCPPVETHHAGEQIAKWDFENTTVTEPRGWQDVNAPNGWVNVSDYAEGHNLGTYAKTMEVANGTNGSLTGYGVGEHQWLDTAASPGNIWIQLSEDNRTTNIEHDSLLTFSIAKQQFGDGSGGSNGDANSHTDPNAFVEILWNYEVVATVKASDLNDFNKFHEFSVVVHANGDLPTDQLMIRSGGTGTTAQGLAIDHIVLNECVAGPKPHLSGQELVANWNFEADNANNDKGFVDLDSISGWHNEAGTSQPMQVQHEKFGFVKGFAADEHQWLDTSASPGNIKISQELDLDAGRHAQLSVSVAAEDIQYFNGATTDTYRPDADDHLLFKFNGQSVLDIKLADFVKGDGTVDWNKFHDFKVDVTGQAGADKLTIESTGMDQHTGEGGVIHGYAGFAVDHVSLQEWCGHAGTSLLAESFEDYTTVQLDHPSGGWEAVSLASGGWDSHGAVTEVTHDNYFNTVHSSEGKYWLDTQATTGGIDISHSFTDKTGGKALVGFDLSTEDFSGAGFPGAATDPDTKFIFKVDGKEVDTITAAELRGLPGGDNTMHHFEYLVDTGCGCSTHTVEFVDASPNASNFGFALDNIQVHDWIV